MSEELRRASLGWFLSGLWLGEGEVNAKTQRRRDAKEEGEGEARAEPRL